ncbi:unnamed protein product, partial [Fusarium langsethiae]
FLQKLRAVFPPGTHSEGGQDPSPALGKDLFVPGLWEIDSKLEEVKLKSFSSDSFINLDDLSKPSIAEKILAGLDDRAKVKTGTTMEVLYQEQVKEMVRTSEIPTRLDHATEMFWLGHPEGRDPAERAESRRKWDERRTSQSLSDSSTLVSEGLEIDSTSLAQKARTEVITAEGLLAMFEKL